MICLAIFTFINVRINLISNSFSYSFFFYTLFGSGVLEERGGDMFKFLCLVQLLTSGRGGKERSNFLSLTL
jgi:hypothetical protein